jgi:predicted naringenin-chalcone synthase
LTVGSSSGRKSDKEDHMGLAILGLGTATPPLRVTQDEAARVAAIVSASSPSEAEFLSILYQQTHIAARHMVGPSQRMLEILHAHRANEVPEPRREEPIPSTAERMAIYQRESLPLALTACRRALSASGIAPRELSHLVTVSCTGFAAPGVDVGLVKELNLAATVERTHVGFMGCHGAFNGLRVARSFVESDRRARVLVCSVELCTPHYYYPWRLDRAVANALFGDGAAALIAGRAEVSDPWQAVANGSCLFPDSEAAMTWTIGDHGFEMTLSKNVPELIAARLRPWLATWLAGHNLHIDQIASWAIHPGGPRILAGVEATLELPPGTASVSRDILRDFGNMSSATILFIIERLRERAAPRPCVALGFGPGLNAEAILFR